METIESLKSLLLEKDAVIAQKDAEIKRLSEQCDYHFRKQLENSGDGINARIKLH